MKKTAGIPQFRFNEYRQIHRPYEPVANIQPNHFTEFECYSTEGIRPTIGPVKLSGYRVGFTLSGSVDVELGLEKYTHQQGTINFTAPGQIFSFSNASEDFLGYYFLFDESFLDINFITGLPFFLYSGVQFFKLSHAELEEVKSLTSIIFKEIETKFTDYTEAIKMHFGLLLICCKRSYERQGLLNITEHNSLIEQYRKLVGKHYLHKRNVADYALLMHITANHLNKVIKQTSGKTASAFISEMLLLEAKAQLKYTSKSIAELAYQLHFSEPSNFNRFFKNHTGTTPLEYRLMHNQAY